MLDEAAMRAEIRTRDVPVVTHTAPPPPEFELVDPDQDESRWPLTQTEALGIALQDPWRASEDGQLMGCQFHGAPRQATVTYGFDFDGTLSVRTHGAKHVAHVERYAHQVEVLRRLHAQGAALYVATNESIAHTANWQAEKRAAHLGAKLRRLEAFAESLGEDIPLLVVIALTNKEGDCHKRGPHPPTGMWRAVQKALGVTGEAHTYIGDLDGGNGRERDDRRFAEANGLAFHTEVEFFEGRHPASGMEESPAFVPEKI